MSDECGKMPQMQARLLSPVTLAFLGDAVYTLFAREYLIRRGECGANHLHRLAMGYVSARTQAAAAERILPCLNPEEADIYRRGRNAHTTHAPKNADALDYRHATGLEALVGYLYLCGERERLERLFELIFKED